MTKIITIDGKDYEKSATANMLRVAFFSRELKNEANLNSIESTLCLDKKIMKRLEKLKDVGEKKGSAIILSYLKDLDKGYVKFDETKLENLELLLNVWDDYNALNKTYLILLRECTDLLDKYDENSSKKVSGFLSLFKKKFKNDIETIELNKMKQISNEGKKIISSEEHKVKKMLVGIGDDAKDTTLFSFLRCNIYNLLELRTYINNKNEKYKIKIDSMIDIINNWEL